MYEVILELRADIERCQGSRLVCAALPTIRQPGRVRNCLIFSQNSLYDIYIYSLIIPRNLVLQKFLYENPFYPLDEYFGLQKLKYIYI